MKRTELVGGGNEQEGNIFLEGTAAEDVQSAVTETGVGDLLLPGWALIGCDPVHALAAPEGRKAECDGPVPIVLPDGSVAIVHELIAVVFELLAEVIQHRPTFMTGRTAQAILPGESRQRARRLAGAQDQKG